MGDTILENNYCNDLKTIPQFSGTCWFNSIIHVMLYSDNFRKYLQSHFKSKMFTDPTYDKFFKFLSYMLKYHNNIEKLEKVYKSFETFKLKPEYLLFSYLNKYDLDTKKIMKSKLQQDIINLGYTYIYITHILNTYNIPFINLIKHNDKIYINLKLKDNKFNINTSNFDFNNTNILIVNHNFSSLYDFNDINENNIFKNKDVYKSINNIDKEIVIDSNIFELDCCIITNSYDNEIIRNNSNLPYHAISGITCGENQYLIDSSYTRFIKNKNLLKYNWYNHFMQKKKELIYFEHNKDNNTISIKSKLKLISDYYNTNFLYNYNDSNIIFIYIKKLNITQPLSLIESENNISFSEFRSKSISKFINSYYNLNNLNLDNLFNLIKKIYKLPSSTKISSYKNVKDNYNYIFNKYFKMNIDTLKIKNDDDKLLRCLFINLLKYYIKNNTQINIIKDKDISIEIIDYYLKKTTTEIIKYINDIYKLIISKEVVDIYYDFLFKINKKEYDKLLNEKIKGDEEDNKIKRLLIRFILDKEIYNINFIESYIKSLKLDDLFNLIKKQYKLSSSTNINSYQNVKDKYNYIFNIYFTMNIDKLQFKNNDNELLRYLFINLLKYYIIKNKLINIISDETISNNIINEFNNKTTTEIEDYIEKEIKIKIKNTKQIVDKYYDFLFKIHHNELFDKLLNETIKGDEEDNKIKRLLIRIILDKKIYNINYIESYNKKRKRSSSKS